MLDFAGYSQEIIDFVNADTLKAIDWGVLDLGHVRDLELRQIMLAIEEELEVELKRNYEENGTGIFRVSKFRQFWCYGERGYVIRARSLSELKEIVESQNRIWYVFDYELFEISSEI